MAVDVGWAWRALCAPCPRVPIGVERGLWQRRYWEHAIRDDADLERHIDYIHFNPVKHRLVSRVCDWPHSSFKQYVERGDLPPDWAATREFRRAANTANSGSLPPAAPSAWARRAKSAPLPTLAALLNLLNVRVTTGNARKVAGAMRALGFIPLKSRRLEPGGWRQSTTRGWTRPIRETKDSCPTGNRSGGNVGLEREGGCGGISA